MNFGVRAKVILIAAVLLSQQAEARFYAPGVGDPQRDGNAVQMQYTVVRHLPPPKEETKVVYKLNQAEMHRFAQKARALTLPEDRSIELGRGAKLREEFSLFLNPQIHARQFKAEKIELVKIGKPLASPDFVAAERHQVRAELLFGMLRGENREAATAFWNYANLKDSSDQMRRRDAVFAGIAAERLGWDNTALMAFDFAIDQGLGRVDWLKALTKKEQDRLKETRGPASTEDAKVVASNTKAAQEKLTQRLDREKSELNYYTNVLMQSIAKLHDENSVDLLIDRVDGKLVTSLPANKELDRSFFSIAKRRFASDVEGLEYIESKLSENSPVTEKMQLLRALSLIENRKHKEALQLLKSLANSENTEINEKARVNLARLLAIFSQHDQALAIYRTIPIDSLIRLDSLLEIAWLEFENGDFQYSLGKSIGLQTKFYYHAFVPEIFVLEAYSRKSLCDFGGAEHAMNSFKQDYSREIRELRELVRKKVSDKNFSMYDAVKHAFRNQDQERIRRFERYLLQVPTINSMQMTLFSLQKEQQLLAKEALSDPVRNNQEYMQHRDFLMASLDKYYAKKKSDFAPVFEQKIYDELKHLDRKLLALFQQAEYLTLDISAAADATHSLQAALNYPDSGEEKEEDIPDTKARWPFEDKEFWEDEIAWLRVTNPSKCVPKSKEDPESGPLASTAP